MEKGISERLVIPDLGHFVSSIGDANIPIMKNYSVDYNKVTSILIAGNSGSGKSYALTYFLSILQKFF